jgi:hypothetical protein
MHNAINGDVEGEILGTGTMSHSVKGLTGPNALPTISLVHLMKRMCVPRSAFLILPFRSDTNEAPQKKRI